LYQFVRIAAFAAPDAAHRYFTVCLQTNIASRKPHRAAPAFITVLFLPQEKRRAITALCAFCREVDDIVDEIVDDMVARSKLAWWRKELQAMLNGEPTHPVTSNAAAYGDF
jgi:hypothetical protein